MNIDKMAQEDAYKYAFAELFFGEGAGIRRRLVNAEVTEKMFSIDGYEDAFNRAYNMLDKTKIAESAVKYRKSLDRAHKAGKNLRAIRSGNLQNLSTGVFVVIGAAYVAHVTGYDKKIEAEAKKLYKKARIEVKYRKARWQGRNVEKII